MSRHSRFSGSGYALIDNSASDWGNKIESDILVCVRCQKTLFRHNTIDHLGILHLGWEEEGGYCHRCDGPLCPECAAPNNPCPPGCGGFIAEFVRRIELAYRREQNARVLGV